MSIEIGSKWVKDGEVVKIENIFMNSTVGYSTQCVWFMYDTKPDFIHVLTERDFFEQYKPYEEYVYRWVHFLHEALYFTDEKLTREEFEKHYLGGNVTLYACISETKEKRERKCTH